MPHDCQVQDFLEPASRVGFQRRRELIDLQAELDTLVHDTFESKPAMAGAQLPSGNRFIAGMARCFTSQ